MTTQEHRDILEKKTFDRADGNQPKSSNDSISERLMEREVFPTKGGVELQSINWSHVMSCLNSEKWNYS